MLMNFWSFFLPPPGWSLSASTGQSTKKEKMRLTFLACCYSDGSEKCLLVAVGCFCRSHPFGRTIGKKLGFYYHAKNTAWMINDLLFSWLEHFNSNLGRTANPKCLLFLYNFSVDRGTQVIPQLRIVENLFLPPNTTSDKEPLKEGLIDAVKVKYRRRIFLYLVEQ